MDFGVTKKTDWALMMYKQVNVHGTMMHGLEVHDGMSVDTLELAFEMIKEEPDLFEDLVTHKFRIEDYKTAFSVAANKGKNSAIKVAFDFNQD
jgi:L-iditol 2-dehydrogenase